MIIKAENSMYFYSGEDAYILESNVVAGREILRTVVLFYFISKELMSAEMWIGVEIPVC